MDTENNIIIAGYGGGGCFPGASKVLTPSGYKSISSLKVGDKVISFNESGKLSESTIQKVFIHKNYEVFEYSYWGGKLYATPNHWVLNQNNSFSEIGKLTEHDCLVDGANNLRPLISSQSYSTEDVYNLSVTPDHTYIVDNIRVHNGGGGKGGHEATEAPEGFTTGSNLLELSKTRIETLDLISEGQIDTLVTGEYTYSGNLGNIGWNSAVFKPYPLTSGLRWLPSVNWNDTPVVDKNNGKFNFQQVTLNYTRGGPNGSNISDQILDELSVTRIISERLRGGGENFAKIYRILDKDCIAAIVNIRVGQFAEVNQAGDILVTSVTYSLYYRPVFDNKSGGDFLPYPFIDANGVSTNIRTLYGKVNNGYIRSRRITFPNNYSNDNDFIGWEIKIIRWTEDSTTSRTRNQTFVDSLTEIYGSKFIYPNSAIVSSVFDAEFFSNIPARTYEAQLLKVKVPSNYDPILKTYDEYAPWSGTFKEDSSVPPKILKQWTDNPAWCYYDLLTNKRYGLGQYIDEDFVDKFSLYEIGKYCDTLVSDGYGGLEPRFTCNLYITSQDEAYKVINSMASIFRGITYYSAGQIYTAQDSQKTPIYQFTNANVVDGDFTYSSSSRKARHTIAVVRYNDKKNFYKPAIEYVEDVGAIRKYGLRDVDVPAYGCTSRGQAIRLGRWALLTESLETESINFKAGIEIAGLLRPGDVFQIYDANRKTQRLGGRLTNIIASPTSTSLTLDSEITGLDVNTTYKLSLLTPTYYYDPSLVTGLTSADASNIRRSQIQYFTFNSSNTSTISGLTNININQTGDYINYNVSGNNIWLIEATGASIYGNIKANEWDTYRIINIKENESHIYEVDGLEYNVDKFLQIESGFSFTDSVAGDTLSFASPSSINLHSRLVSTHSKVIDYDFPFPNLTNIKNFRVFAKDGAFLPGDISSGNGIIAELPISSNNGSYFPSHDATYYFRVYSVGLNNALSNGYGESNIKIEGVNPILDVTISSLQLKSNNIIANDPGKSFTGIYSTDSPIFDWQIGIGALTNVPSDLTYRITARAPSQSNQPSKDVYFEITGYTSETSEYTFPFTGNYNAISRLSHKPGPFRDYDLVVESLNSGGYSSAGGYFNPDPNYHDSDFNNPNGYDILYVNNPKPSGPFLFTGNSNDAFYLTGKATQQWITQDGEIKMFFTDAGDIVPLSGWFGDDIAGGTLYYSNQDFNLENIIHSVQFPPNSPISHVQAESNNNPLIIPVGLFNAPSQYIALAPYDSFDVATSKYINDYLVTGLNISNVIKINKQTLGAGAYKAWVEFDVALVGNDIKLLDNWQNRSFNIRPVVGVSTKTIDANSSPLNVGSIQFENPITSKAYAINVAMHIFQPPNFFMINRPQETALNIYRYDQNEILFTDFRNIFPQGTIAGLVTGRCFIGVLSQ